jgi:hypothetical protein
MKIKPLPPASRVRELLNYDPETGVFRWAVQVAQRCPAGAVAGTATDARRYRTISIDRCIYLAHRVAWLYVTGEDPGAFQIDHINGSRDDNSIKNLRLATKTENMRNVKRPTTNKTGYKGVYFDTRLSRFRSCIRVNGKTKSLGTFQTAEEAHAAYCGAAKIYYGQFARSS